MSIVTYPLDGITYDAADAETYLCTRTSGVFSADNCFNYTLTGDLKITIGAGIAWVNNADFKGKSICNKSAVELTIPLGDSYNPRIDRVVLEYSAANNESTLKIIQGTAAATPTAPAIIQTSTVYQLGLYTIYVARAATAVSAANVTDTRLDSTVCGLMQDSVTSIPTAELYAQFMAWFDDIREFLSAEDTAANSLQLEGHAASYFLPATGTAANSLQLEGHAASYFASKSDLDNISKLSTLPASNTALAANTIYTISSSNAVSNYTFKQPGSGKWAHGTFYAGDTNISFSPATFLTERPTIVTGRQYEFDVYNGIWVVALIT